MTSPAKLILETERLVLREFVPEDAQAFFELNSAPEVLRYTGDTGPGSVEEARQGLCERPILDYQKHGFGRWAVIFRETGELIGFAGLKYLDDLQEVDLGYRFLPRYWGLGLATEASRPCIDYGFATLRLPRILGLVDPQNVRSVRVLQKLGFIFDGMIEYRSHPTARYLIITDRPRTNDPTAGGCAGA
jgi:RimJ/RimL family protein N-acetyltransferase